VVDPLDPYRGASGLHGKMEAEDLLVPVLRAGAAVYQPPALAECTSGRGRRSRGSTPVITALPQPHSYPVGLERSHPRGEMAQVLAARGGAG